MWNSSGQQNNDLSKQVSDLSAALNLRPDCLQQFMSGNLSIEALAALRPQQTNTGNEGNSSGASSSSMMWEHVPQTTSLFPSVHAYEGVSFNNILSGASQNALLHQSTAAQPSTSFGSPFRSPPFTSDSTSLMELSTVTPSRIKNSPSAIISKGVTPNVHVDDREIPSTSKSTFPFASAPSELLITPHTDIVPSTSSILSEDQFKIVIGNQPSDSPADKFTINLDVLDERAEVASQATEEDTSFPTTNTQSDTDEDMSDFDTASQSDQESGDKEIKRKRKRNVLSKLPKHLRGLMGEANLAYARGAHEDAIKMCMEVIRLAPYAAEPYDTLAIIYEEKGEPVRSLQYSLLSAHLSRTSATQWISLAGMCLNQGDVEKAIDCYTRAAKARPADYKLQLECGKLCMKHSNIQKAMYFYKSAVMVMPPEEGKEAVDLARELAKVCHNKKQNITGIGLLEQAFESHPTQVSDEDANLLCELYLMEKQFTDVFRLLARHSEMNVVFEDYDNPDYNTIQRLEPPENMAVDLMCKVAVAAIQLNRSDLASDIVKTICAHNPTDTGDIQFEVAEAYMTTGNYSEALAILDNLVTSRDYALAAVWLKHGECHSALKHSESAVVSYRNCVRLAPGYIQAHLRYSRTLRKAEKFFIAAQTLDNAENYEIDPEDHMRLYYERFKVYKMWSEKSKKKRDLISHAADAALLMFANKFKTSAFKEAKVYLVRRKHPSTSSKTGDLKLIQVRQLQLPDQKNLDESDLYFKDTVDIFSKEKWLKFYESTVAILHKCKRYKDALCLSEGLQYYSKWSDHPPTRKRLANVSFVSSVLEKDYQQAYRILSAQIRSDLNNNAMWNYFNQLIVKTEDQRHQKFCLRILIKHPHLLPIAILSAHNWMASGFYKTALGEYMYAHKKFPDEPLYVMMIAVAFINLSSQKFTDFKHSFITQALAYFQKYLELRKLDQESYYNIARAMHQVGLEHFAIHYYEKALEFDPPLVNGYETDDRFDLRREIAFNLSLIYRKSNNHETANRLLEKYCVV